MRILLGAIVVILVLAIGGHAAPAGSDSALIGRELLKTHGLRVYFENRYHAYGWNSGDLIQQLAGDEPLQREVALQLDRMHALGVNEIGFELRSVGDVQDNQPPPDCRLASYLGAHWPDPLPNELTGLRTVMALVRGRGMRLVLHLTNTHHDAPWSTQERWLGPLLGVVKDDPALDYVTFDGDVTLLPNGQCGGQSEAALWNGQWSPTGRYVANAIRYGIELGMSPRTLTAETIVPFPFGPWEPIDVMNRIFDELGVPDDERTYAVSIYEHEPEPHRAADAAFAHAYQIIGKTPRDPGGARVTLSEFGNGYPIPPDWPTSHAVESLGVLMQQYGMEGGNFWLWAEMNDDYESRRLAEAVKRRGATFTYNPVAKEIKDLYGFHVESIPAGSFEHGWRSGWTISGSGSARGVPFDDAVRLPWRGRTVLRLTGRPRIAVTSSPLRVSGGVTYSTTGDFRVAQRGSWVAFRYLTCAGGPSSERSETRFALRATPRYEAFPLRYTTPSDACFVRIRIVAVHGRLFADNLR